MNWRIALEIVMGIVILFYLCCVWAVLEAEYKKHREEKKWQEWADREKKRGLRWQK